MTVVAGRPPIRQILPNIKMCADWPLSRQRFGQLRKNRMEAKIVTDKARGEAMLRQRGQSIEKRLFDQDAPGKPRRGQRCQRWVMCCGLVGHDHILRRFCGECIMEPRIGTPILYRTMTADHGDVVAEVAQQARMALADRSKADDEGGGHYRLKAAE